MKSILTAAVLLCLLASCQKEVSIDTGNTSNAGTAPGAGSGTGSTSGLLVKTVAVTGAETQTTLYTYDAQKRLETVTTKGTAGGMAVDNYQKFVRDAAGRIVKVLQKLGDQPASGATSDTAVKTFYYPDPSTLNYTYSIGTMSLNTAGFSMTNIDSTVYNYSGSKITSFNSYMFSSLMPGMPMMSSRYDFSYDASNRVTDMKMYNDAANPGGNLDLSAQTSFTYTNTAVNNTYATANAAQNLVLFGTPNTTSDAVSKVVTSSINATPAINVTITMSFVTGAGNKPVSGTATTVTTGQPTQTTQYTFYYQ